MKSALIAHSNNDWVSCLPLVLLGIRSSFKEDIKSTIAELVYGESLRLPSEFFCSDSSTDRPGGHQEVLSDLRKYFSDLRPSPASRHGNPSTFVFKELKDCTHAYLKDCRFLKALQSPYTGPYEIINRDDKLITLKINNAPVKVSIDRVKPAFLLNSCNNLIAFSVHDSTNVPALTTVPAPAIFPVTTTQPAPEIVPVSIHQSTTKSRLIFSEP
uniref:Uncharacterized protein n=1 Tax=Trichogramma kaykai TaxID=54128 RepID=A0ABD2W6Y3_9HYME